MVRLTSIVSGPFFFFFWLMLFFFLVNSVVSVRDSHKGLEKA